MSSDRHTLFLFWGGLLVLLASLLAMAAFVLVLPALAQAVFFTADLPGTITEQDCQAFIRDELHRMPTGGIRYIPAGEETSYPSWSFTAITGATRTLKWLRAEFDLVQVYFRRAGPDWNGELFDWDGQEIAYAWVAYAVSSTAGVRTPDGWYLASGGLPPFSRSKSAQGFQPGKYLVTVSANGPFVTHQGFDCAGLEFSPFCQVEQSFLPGASGVFIENGYIAKDPLNGFLFWAVQVEETLNLCKEQPWYAGR
ncbi:MAG: hypothetical protein AB1894_07655 [Chloroflexota bacterium]